MCKTFSASFFAGVILCATFAGACGDKLLMLGRRVEFADIASRPGSLLLYVPSSVPASGAVGDPSFLAALRKAKQKVRLIESPSALAEALPSGLYDAVLVDPRDATVVEQEVAAAGVNTVVVRVDSEKQGRSAPPAGSLACLRKVPGNDRDCFSAVGKAIALKLKRDERRLRASR